MRKTGWTPSIVSKENDRSVYLVADDFGKAGSACRRCDEQMRDIPFFLQEFTDQYDRYRDIQLPLPMRLV